MEKDLNITQKGLEILEENEVCLETTRATSCWKNNYRLARAYYEHYGDLEIPRTFRTKNGVDYDENGNNLGNWLFSQRKAYNGKGSIKITPEKIKLLENIGMRWTIIVRGNLEAASEESLVIKKVNEERWIQNYNLARVYYKHYGDLEVPFEFKTINGIDYNEDGIRLGAWVSYQRKAVKKKCITPEQIKLLDDIKMRWDNIDKMTEWMSKYSLAQAYYGHYGNLEVSRTFRTINGIDYDKEGVHLGEWIANQRRGVKEINTCKVTPEQIKLLNKIGMRWDNIDRMTEWINKYNLAKAYYEHYGDLEIPFDFKTKNGVAYDEDGIKLGRWIQSQRYLIKQNKMTSERIKLLEKIDFDNIGKMTIWMNKYDLAKAYYEYYGDLEIPAKFKTKNGVDYDEAGIKLGTWINTQRQSFQEKGSGIINSEQVKLLEKIGMRWNNIDRMAEWMNKYNLAKKYYEYYGNLEMPQTFKTKNGVDYDEAGIKLGRWTNTQRQAFKGNGQWKMTSEQIRLLNEIGMQWDRRYEQWMYKYALAKAYYEYYGDLEIPAKFKTKNGIDYNEDGIKLGMWIFHQRNSYNGKGTGIINYEQVKLLEEIGMKWFADNKDYKLQNEIINEDNIKRKQKEITNRFYSVLSSFDDEELPTKEELNNKLLCKLNHIK